MSQREMEAVLKALDALACAACVFVCALVIPGVESEGSVPAGSVPCFAVGIAPLLALGAVSWGLFSAIGCGETFVQSNAHRLRTMGYLAAADAVVWLALLVAYALVASRLWFSVVASLSVALIFAVSLAVVCVALSHLTSSAASLKDENDLVV